ncbi:hypothetical protein [Oxynema aestuarii]|nr:hypothetical protein [Oxynema aestuarii]
MTGSQCQPFIFFSTNMEATYTLYNPNITELFSQVYAVRKITGRDRQFLKSAILHHPLTPEEMHLIDRLVYAVRRGWLQMID